MTSKSSEKKGEDQQKKQERWAVVDGRTPEGSKALDKIMDATIVQTSTEKFRQFFKTIVK